MTAAEIILLLLAGGAAAAAVFFAVNWSRAKSEAADARREQADAGARLEETRRENDAAAAEINTLRAARDELKQAKHETETKNAARIAELEATLNSERRHMAEQSAFAEKNEKAMEARFKNLAQSVLSDNSRRFSESHKKELAPLQDNLQDFRRRLDALHGENTKERAALREHIKQLQDNAGQISRDAGNLARALKGDKKAQGNWGEMRLLRLLELSGLRRGEDYETQRAVAGDDGRRLIPDVIIHLPEAQHLIVDAKVSLAAYEEYVAADDEGAKQAALARHLQALRAHVDGLAQKNYPAAQGVNAPEFVLLFMPIEPALLVALQESPDLFARAFDKKIVLTGPTTIMPVLKTVAHIWKTEKQHQHSMAIADQGGRLYDKFAGFVDDMDKIGRAVDKLRDTYDSARGKLATGRGNLIGQAEKLRALGVNAQKRLPAAATAAAGADDDEA